MIPTFSCPKKNTHKLSLEPITLVEVSPTFANLPAHYCLNPLNFTTLCHTVFTLATQSRINGLQLLVNQIYHVYRHPTVPCQVNTIPSQEYLSLNTGVGGWMEIVDHMTKHANEERLKFTTKLSAETSPPGHDRFSFTS